MSRRRSAPLAAAALPLFLALAGGILAQAPPEEPPQPQPSPLAPPEPPPPSPPPPAAPEPAPSEAEPPEAQKPKSEPEEEQTRQEKPKVELSGYLQLDYRRGRDEALEAPAHEFNARRARIGFSGQLTERLSYALLFQGDGLSVGSGSLIDASASLKLSAWARLQAGQFKYDFDLQGRESDALLSFSDRPDVTQVVAGSLDGTSTPDAPQSAFRDRGLSLRIGPPSGRLLGSLGLYQGSGRRADDNASFAPVLRLQGSPWKGLLLSAGFLYADNVDGGAAGRDEYRAFTLGGAWERGKLLLRGEYYQGRRRKDAGEERAEGFYVHAVRTLGKDFEAMARYQYLEDPAVLAGGSLRSVDLGGRYYFARLGARGGTSLLVNVLLRQAGDGPLQGQTVLNDGRGAAVTRGQDLEPVLVARLQVQF